MNLYDMSCLLPLSASCEAYVNDQEGSFIRTLPECEGLCPPGKFLLNTASQSSLVGHFGQSEEDRVTKLLLPQLGITDFSIYKPPTATEVEDRTLLKKKVARLCAKCPADAKLLGDDCIDTHGCRVPWERWLEKEKLCVLNICDPSQLTGSKSCVANCESNCQFRLGIQRGDIELLARGIELLQTKPDDSALVIELLTVRNIGATPQFRKNPQAVIGALKSILSRMQNEENDLKNANCKQNRDACRRNYSWRIEELERLFGRACVHAQICDVSNSSCSSCFRNYTNFLNAKLDLLKARQNVGSCAFGQVERLIKALFELNENRMETDIDKCQQHKIQDNECRRSYFPTEIEMIQYLENRGVNCRYAPSDKSTPATTQRPVGE